MAITVQSTIFLLFIQLVLIIQMPSQSVTGYLTNDGAWCWFSDPRAIAVDDAIITGWVKSDGTIEACRLDLTNFKIKRAVLHPKLERDDHDNPAFVHTSDGKVIAMYSSHSKKELFYNEWYIDNSDFTFSEVKLLNPLDEEELKAYPRASITYANPYQLSTEQNKIYCFGRWTGFKPNVMTSDDHGKSWSKGKVFITNHPFSPNNRPYVKYHSDGLSRIHFVFTDGHPRVEPENSVYYAYLENRSFYKANGDKIVSLDEAPFEPKDASIIFKSNHSDGRAWIADIGQDGAGLPVVLYTKSPTENNHEYWYARYYAGQWENHKICASGPWFPQTPEGKKEPEPHYFGGLTINPENPNVVYLSRKIEGVFEIERWETDNLGKSWINEAVTKNSTFDNVRPYIPRGLDRQQAEIVFWMENRSYIHYTDFDGSIRYLIRKSK